MKLTKEQEKMVADAIGDGSDWPKMTSDPYVNHRVDWMLHKCPSWEKLSQEDKDLYIEEAAAFLVGEDVLV